MAIEISNLSALNEKAPVNVWNDISYAILLCKADKKLYERYKKCREKAKETNTTNVMINELSDDQIREMQTLSILEGLGYSLDQMGTYLYKEVIMTAYKDMVYNDRPNLAKDMNDVYSDFYQQIARDYYEMGVSSFHEYIRRATPSDDGKDYRIEAFKIASGMSEKQNSKETKIVK